MATKTKTLALAIWLQATMVLLGTPTFAEEIVYGESPFGNCANHSGTEQFPGHCCEQVFGLDLWSGYCYEKRPPYSRPTLSPKRPHLFGKRGQCAPAPCGGSCFPSCPSCSNSSPTKAPQLAPTQTEELPRSEPAKREPKPDELDSESNSEEKPSPSETAPISRNRPADEPPHLEESDAEEALPKNTPAAMSAEEGDSGNVDLPENPVVAPEPGPIKEKEADDESDVSVLGIEDEGFQLPSNEIDGVPPRSKKSDDTETPLGESDLDFWDMLPKNESDDDDTQESIEEQIKALLDSDIGIPDNSVTPHDKSSDSRGSLRERLRIRQMSVSRARQANPIRHDSRLRERITSKRRTSIPKRTQTTSRLETLLRRRTK